MRNMGMIIMIVVIVLIRGKLRICDIDERWFGCVYFYCLLFVNMRI